MKTNQISKDIWVIVTEKDKYVGMIRYYIPDRYIAIKDGKVLGEVTTLEEAEKYFAS